MFHNLKIHNSLIATHAYYRILSCHYFSEPGLSCDAMHKMTKREIEFIPDPDMYIFVIARRGAISYISNRYSKVNHKYLKSYDANQ